MNQPINILKTLKSFKYAGAGIFSLFRHENNAKVHILAASIALILGVYFEIASYEWISIFIVIGLVCAAEAINTAIEKLADVVSPTYHEGIKVVKDLAAAAVLILAITSAIVGGIIFLPKIYTDILGFIL